MPLDLDKVDAAILKTLMDDGRRSFRQIAGRVGVSTPTVESRVRRMTDSGIIRKIAPILDVDKIEGGVAALVMLRVDLRKIASITPKLAALVEVRNIFLATGEANMILRVVAETNERFQDFLDSNIASLEGANMVSSQMVTKTIKDEQGIAPLGDISVNLVCDYCDGQISGKPFTLNVGDGKRFFCCRTCLTAYKEKYRSRMTALETGARRRKEHTNAN